MKIAVWMDRGKMVRAAMGEIPCDLTVCNIQLVNMFTGEVYPAQDVYKRQGQRTGSTWPVCGRKPWRECSGIRTRKAVCFSS